MKLWLSFTVLIAVASFCKAVPLKDNIGNSNEVDEEMKGKSSIDLDMDFNFQI